MAIISDVLDSDWATLARILSDPLVVASLNPLSTRRPNGIDELAAWCAPPVGATAVLAASRSEAGALRGSIRIDRDHLSYVVDPEFWGQGYGGCMVRWSVLNARQLSAGACLHAITVRRNLASIRLLERAGFRFAGISHEHYSFETLLRFTLRL